MGLTAQGYQTLEAANGKAALDLLKEAPDLIILDLGLPDTLGHDLLRTIRARNDGVPIIVLSSRGDEASKVQALDLGADDYVTSRSAWTNCSPACARRCGISCRPTASGRCSVSATSPSISSAVSSSSAPRR
jgi:PleD family two-component response regulator